MGEPVLSSAVPSAPRRSRRAGAAETPRGHDYRDPAASAFPSLLSGAAFFLSGAAGLLYESLWTRYLGLFLGHSAYAQVLVLMIFLGGTALGALLAGLFSERVRRPLLWYAAAEVVIGIAGFAFHGAYGAMTSFAYDRMLPATGDGAAMTLVQWAMAGALILPQSVLLGSTFPLISASLLRRDPTRVGRSLALLYCLNGLGGAIGVLVGGFWLVGSRGLPGTLSVAGTLNLLAGVLAVAAALASRGRSAPTGLRDSHPHGHEPPRPRAVQASPTDDAILTHGWLRPRTVLLGVAVGTALTSLTYEIAWTRMLSLVLGGATHAFDLMLSAFILGLALGAYVLHRRADSLRDPLRTLGVVQCVMGALAVATLPLYLGSFGWSVSMLAALDTTPQGYAMFSVARYALCLAIMLPATFCAGMTLPLVTQILVRRGVGESAVGMVYGMNTIGAIAGVAMSALVLLPVLGLKGLVVAAATVDMLLGAWVFAVRERAGGRRPVRAVGACVAALAIAGIVLGAVPFDRELLTSGVFRSRKLSPPGTNRVVFYRDGRTATVSGMFREPGTMMLATNGKVDASLSAPWLRPGESGAGVNPLAGDAATQTLLAVMGLAHTPAARHAAVIGQGSGMTSHLLLGSPTLSEVATIEIEPEMILGSNVFYPANRRVFDDPRSHFVVQDARAFFAASGKQFDLIVSEPSNPWVSGVSGLFTREFYSTVSRRLAPGGHFLQWIQLYESNDELLLGILAAMHANFRSYALYHSANMDLLVVAGNEATLPRPDWSVAHLPLIAADMRAIRPLTPETLDALWIGERAVFAPLLDEGVLANSDYFPFLDLFAERERYLGHSARAFATMASFRFDPFAALTGHRVSIGVGESAAIPEVERASAAAVSAQLKRSVNRNAGVASLDADVAPALLRKRMLDVFLAASEPPPSWQLWMRNVALVERDVHGLSAGAADTAFFASVERYMTRAHAPVRARAALQFLRGLAAWDFPRAATAADELIPDAKLGEGWVPADMLRDGAVTAKLLSGDVAGARQAFGTLTSLGGSGTDLRSRLLDAHIRAAERRSR